MLFCIYFFPIPDILKKPSNSNVQKKINQYLESIIVYREIDLQKTQLKLQMLPFASPCLPDNIIPISEASNKNPQF